MEHKLNTTVSFALADGTETDLTLTFYALYLMKSKHKGLYDRYNKIMAHGVTEELEMVTVLYTAYVCAHLNDENLMTEEEFMIGCGCDRKAVAETVKKLTTPKN